MPQTQMEVYAELDALLDKAKFPEAIEQMRLWNKVWLHQFYESYPQRYVILKHPDFDDFWAERRAALYPKCEFKPQDQMKDIDFVLGYVFYLLALKAKPSNSQDYLKHLKSALRFQSIHAAQTFFSEFLKNTESDKKVEDLIHLLGLWKKLGSQHGSPAYLLLANGYLQFARMLAERKDYLRYELACASLWENLTLAERCELSSANSIHNAYFGQGLALSNPLGIASIEDLKEKASVLITDDSIKQRAEKTAEAILNDSREKAPLLNWLQSRGQAKPAKADTPPSPPPSPF